MGCDHNYAEKESYFLCTKCGHKRQGKSEKSFKSKRLGGSLGILIFTAIAGFLLLSGVIEINQESYDGMLKKMPQNIQDAGKTAKNIAGETTTILRETINQNIGPVQLRPVDRLVSDIKQIPKHVKENNPLNEKPVIDKRELEMQIHQLTNQFRQENGLEELSWDEELSSVARGHSKDMAWREYFDHKTPEGWDATERATFLKYKCEKTLENVTYSGIGENIFQNNLYGTVWNVGSIPTAYEWNSQEDIAQSTVQGWMNSTGHRENILTDTYDREGIGVEIAEDDRVYITQNFC